MTCTEAAAFGLAVFATGCRPTPDASVAALATPPSPPTAPAVMRTIPAGDFVMGRDRGGHPDQRPAHRVRISAFRLDETLVTHAAFARYVEATGVRTSAERLGYGLTAVEGMDDWQWTKVAGANWRTPWGEGSDAPRPSEDDPVVMVSWHDADAYCRHFGLRLPTEAEWEYAMRAGAEGTRFPWGDDPHRADGTLGLNFWQGRDHHHDTREDGYLYTSPVRAFPPNAWGIYDPVGNTWQWVADWYGRDTYRDHGRGAVDPQGPAHGWAKVARGGSWWCSARACSAYGLLARGKSRPHAPFSNNGFRCAGDV
jgi:formylglycine-generating enzyme required for sulfatase activity